ncbi:MAG: hypothetical protein D4R43_00485 [Sphingobacteriales bacterium]|nr:MAG: hypothetical protein D4R43_00485 [Sphingobacteriales bacterium]
MIIGVAGTYSTATEEQRKNNLNAMNEAAAKVLEKGHIPIIGMNAALRIVDLANVPGRYKAIMEISLAVINQCEAILILAESPGVMKERDLVLSNAGKIFYSLHATINSINDERTMNNTHTYAHRSNASTFYFLNFIASWQQKIKRACKPRFRLHEKQTSHNQQTNPPLRQYTLTRKRMAACNIRLKKI